jgi:hypothetical protein
VRSRRLPDKGKGHRRKRFCGKRHPYPGHEIPRFWEPATNSVPRSIQHGSLGFGSTARNNGDATLHFTQKFFGCLRAFRAEHQTVVGSTRTLVRGDWAIAACIARARGSPEGTLGIHC